MTNAESLKRFILLKGRQSLVRVLSIYSLVKKGMPFWEIDTCTIALIFGASLCVLAWAGVCVCIWIKLVILQII